jgi:transposase
MIAPGGIRRVFVATRPIDFRKGHDGLSLAVQEMFGLDPFCGAAFVFRSKRADRIKILAWDQTGLVLVHKRLEGGKFVWPQVRDGTALWPSRWFRTVPSISILTHPKYRPLEMICQAPLFRVVAY